MLQKLSRWPHHWPALYLRILLQIPRFLHKLPLLQSLQTSLWPHGLLLRVLQRLQAPPLHRLLLRVLQMLQAPPLHKLLLRMLQMLQAPPLHRLLLRVLQMLQAPPLQGCFEALLGRGVSWSLHHQSRRQQYTGEVSALT